MKLLHLSILATFILSGTIPSTARAATIEAQTNSRLYGSILTTNNLPITNATVTIKKVLAGRGAVYVSDAPDCNRQAMTKADGSFALEGLVANTKFEAVVTAPGYEPSPFYRVEPGGKPLEIKMFPLPIGGEGEQTVHGRVVGIDGKPVKGALIQVHMLLTQQEGHSGGGVAYTDQQGEFTFRPMEDIIACDFYIEANGYVPRNFSEVHPGPVTNLYQLDPGSRVTGRLLKDGQPVPDAGIGMCGMDGGWLDNYSAVTDANGRFTVSGLSTNGHFYLYGMMKSLRDLGALPRKPVKTGATGALIELGDLNLVKGHTISGRLQMVDGKPAQGAELMLARTELTPPADHKPTRQEESNRSFYGLEKSFDSWEVYLDPDGRFQFTGVPGETVSIFLRLKPFDLLSSKNVSSDGKGFRLLGLVVSNKTDLVIELEPHSGQVFPPARDYQVLSRQPLEGAEAVIAK